MIRTVNILLIYAEWTYTLLKFLKDQLGKLSEYYGQPYTSLNQRQPIEIETATTYWNYGIQLTECMMRVRFRDFDLIISYLSVVVKFKIM